MSGFSYQVSERATNREPDSSPEIAITPPAWRRRDLFSVPLAMMLDLETTSQVNEEQIPRAERRRSG
jgi:hypothetical protein